MKSRILQNRFSARLARGLAIVAALLVIKVTASVVLNYRSYFPPDFQSDFLQGRDTYFFGNYQWAFYTHITASPGTLLLGLVLINERFRVRFPRWHRRLGRVQAVIVLCLVVPSGLWMAYRAAGGPVAALGLATLAIATGTTVGLGWRSAVKRRFQVHRVWMWRCYLLLCSAVVLRLIVGLFTVTGIVGLWIDPLVAWAGWLLPIAVFELTRWYRGRG
jgi:Predicted membrane protein (DUF2306)